jgi:hypothetical protein
LDFLPAIATPQRDHNALIGPADNPPRPTELMPPLQNLDQALVGCRIAHG